MCVTNSSPVQDPNATSQLDQGASDGTAKGAQAAAGGCGLPPGRCGEGGTVSTGAARHCQQPQGGQKGGYQA